MVDVGKREDRAEFLRPLVSFGGRYWVSDKGRVWSTMREKFLKMSPGGAGYPQATLIAEDRSRHQKLLHNLVAEAFLGPAGGRIVRHLDDDKLNNYLSNLAYGTYSDNNADVIRNGLNGQLNKTHCPHNHEYTAANTYQNPRTNHRFCRTCKRRMDAEYRARKATR